uniref:Uncharacterized protein n=1 Tax=Plectus sambesii TaxID=2011161 RepID=A0A914UJT9_9BILA
MSKISYILLSPISLLLVFCMSNCCAQVVPIGQFFVGEESQTSDGCDVEFKSEKPVRSIRGCYRAQLNKKRACVTVKYHREIEQCCPSPYADVAVAVAEAHGVQPKMEPCHRVQELYHNYCIDVPSYSLVEGCQNENGCGVEFALHPDSDVLRENKTAVETRIAMNDCFKLTTNIYKGRIIAGCYKIESSSVPERKCIHVKRNVPYKVCCTKRGIDTGSDDEAAMDLKQPFTRPCTQYQEIESEYCFTIPFEAMKECTDLQGQACA